jgi:uncharacterized repeat protein (TIGR03803 family)
MHKPKRKPKEWALFGLGVMALANLVVPSPLTAQTYTVLSQFEATNGSAFTFFTNSEGAFPRGGLVQSGNMLFGTAGFGGSAGGGTLFKVSADGTGFTVMHHFTGASDGTSPRGPLLLIDDTLYGTAKTGGSFGNGTVFRINTDGTGFTVLHHFGSLNPNTGANGDGAVPYGGLLLSDQTLYGTASQGGNLGAGTVFKVNTNGSEFVILHHFTVNDGSQPFVAPVLSGNTLYGTASRGGSGGNGTVFALNTDGSGFTNLYSFSSTAGDFQPNADGAVAIVDLILSGTTLYGAASEGGTTGNGTIFKINTDGSEFAVLYSFSAVPDENNPPFVNEDGATPTSALTLVGGTLYGTTQVGGRIGAGTIFALNTDGSGFTNLHTFTGDDGGTPFGTLLLSGNRLYGTASSIYVDSIGITNYGTVFSLSFAPQLTITPATTGVVLRWPTNVAGFSTAGYTVEETANLTSGSWSAPDPHPPVLVNGQYQVTRPMVGPQISYRLRQ